MGYVGDLYTLRTGEIITSLSSKLADAERIIVHAMRVRQDIGAIVPRLVALRAKVRLLKTKAGSAQKNISSVDAFEKSLSSLIRDESFRLFSIIEADMLLLHDLMEFMHMIIGINHELAAEKVAQSVVKIKLPEIKEEKDAKKAQQQIEAAKKRIDKVANDGKILAQIKKTAGSNTEEIKRHTREIKKQLISLRNKFDGMARMEFR